jgi:hypothetical protein
VLSLPLCRFSTPRGAGAAPRRPDGETWRGDYNRSDVTHGRFTEAEKEALRAAIVAYEEEHDMDTDDHTWLLAATANRRKGAVSQIAGALPHRNRKAVWSCLVRMLSPDNYKVNPGEGDRQGACCQVEADWAEWPEPAAALGMVGVGLLFAGGYCADNKSDCKFAGRMCCGLVPRGRSDILCCM